MSKNKPVTLFQCNRTSSVSYEGQSNRTAGRDRLVEPVSLIQQKPLEIVNLEEAIGEYEFSAVPRSLFASVHWYIAMVWKSNRHHVSELPSPLLHGWEIVDDGTLLLPSDKYELMKQTENIAVSNSQNVDENMDDVARKLRVTCIDWPTPPVRRSRRSRYFDPSSLLGCSIKFLRM